MTEHTGLSTPPARRRTYRRSPLAKLLAPKAPATSTARSSYLVAGALIAAVLVGVLVWQAGWLWFDPPRAVNPVANPGRTVNTRPEFSGRAAAGVTQLRFAIVPPVEIRWTVALDPNTGAFDTYAPVQPPPGSYALHINGGFVRDVDVPVAAPGTVPATPAPNQVESNRPVFRGRLRTGATQAEFALSPEFVVRWTAPVDPATSRYKTMSPVQLPPGSYTYYINDAFEGKFVVKADAE